MTRDEAAGVVLLRVLDWEGGVADVGDGHGVTRFGQTPGWLQQFGLPAPMTTGEALANYRTWLVKTGILGACDAPDIFAVAVVDWAVHAGHRVAIRGLQLALKEAADGVWGPETQAAVDAADRHALACRLVAARARFTFGLLADPARSQWARGWGHRIADQIEALA